MIVRLGPVVVATVDEWDRLQDRAVSLEARAALDAAIVAHLRNETAGIAAIKRCNDRTVAENIRLARALEHCTCPAVAAAHDDKGGQRG